MSENNGKKPIQVMKNKHRIIELLKTNNRINPLRESALVILWYGIFGFLWIALTDTILDALVSDQELYQQIQLAKGWVFVFLTVVIIFLIVRKRIEIIQNIVEEMIKTTHVLNTTSEKLSLQKAITEKIVEVAPVLIAIWDQEGNLKSLNPYAMEVLGYQDLGKTIPDLKDIIDSKIDLKKLQNVFEVLKSGKRLLNFESNLIGKDGLMKYIIWNSGPLPQSPDDTQEYISFGVDITAKKAAEDQLRDYAFKDALTALPNRFALEREMQQRFANPSNTFALLYIDIDNFKYVNDSLGHHVGDELLKYISKCIQKSVGPSNFVARLGGDEFAILIDQYQTRDVVFALAEKIKHEMGKTWFIYNHSFYISLSIGVAISGENGTDIDSLSKNADIAMYCSKNEGKDRVMFFEEAIEQNNLYHIDMAKRLQKAIDQNDFELFYQPQYRLDTHAIEGFEALIRWYEPSRGFISPAEFIPLAEDTGQIYAIERWVFKAALAQKIAWNNQGYGDYSLSINLSSKTLMSDISFSMIETYLSEYSGDLSKIVIEITETALIKDLNRVITRAKRLKDLGVRIALDDFGTGYSSLTHIKMFPVDIVKLDRSFISQIENKGKDILIISSVISLVKSLGYILVAEGIENQVQYDYLLENQCEMGQGFLMSRPVSIQKINQILSESPAKKAQ